MMVDRTRLHLPGAEPVGESPKQRLEPLGRAGNRRERPAPDLVGFIRLDLTQRRAQMAHLKHALADTLWGCCVGWLAGAA
jgi:hypothetical protein